MAERKDPASSTQSATMRSQEFFDQLAQKIMANEAVIAGYKELLEKGRRLDIEFLEGSWQDFFHDRETLNNVTNYIISNGGDLTSDEISKVSDAIRSTLGHAGEK